MDDKRVRRALAHAEEKLRGTDDMAGSLAYVLSSCQDVLDVDAVGVMVISRTGLLQLLAASTHTSAELELHQSQIDEGPCVDAAHGGVSVAVAGEQSIRERWPSFAPAMFASGYRAVHSAPLLPATGGTPIGAMALFRREAAAFDQAEGDAAQSYADLVARLVVGEAAVEPADVLDRVDAALASRVSIERAKGVVSQTHDVDMGQAYELLRSKASRDGTTLTATADELIEGVLRDDVGCLAAVEREGPGAV